MNNVRTWASRAAAACSCSCKPTTSPATTRACASTAFTFVRNRDTRAMARSWSSKIFMVTAGISSSRPDQEHKMTDTTIRLAVLDDYQHVAMQSADWSALEGRADVVVFHDHLHEHDALVERLSSFDAVCVMRERTPMTAELIAALPR